MKKFLICLFLFIITVSTAIFFFVKDKEKSTIAFDEFLYSERDPKDIIINKKDEIIYKGKIVMSDTYKNKPLVNETAITTIEMIINMNAHGIEPKKAATQATH